MPLISSSPLSQSFAGVQTLQAHGSGPDATLYPYGIPGTFDLEDGAAKITVRDTDAGTFGERRAEMTFAETSPTGERWYKWEFMIPTDWNFSAGMAIMQIHEDPDDGAPATAVQFVLMLENNLLIPNVPVNVLAPGASAYRLTPQPFEFGRWYSMCLHANWQITAIGSWELFIDGIAAFRQYGIANAYNYIKGGYLKLGIYNYRAAEGWGTKTIHIRNVNISSGNDGYQAVMGQVPIARPRLQQI